MGLDVIELVMDIEDRFNIEISDDEACQAITVGKMYQCVLDKVKVSTNHRCSSQKAFYTLRKALTENLGIKKKIITPKTNTELLFPEYERRELWSKISENTPYKFPELSYPAAIGILILIIGLTGGILCSYFLFSCFEHNPSVFIFFINWIAWIPLAVLFCKLLFKNLLKFKLIIPRGCNTLGGIAKYILYYNGNYFGTLSQKEIWDKLTFIISEQLGVDQEGIRPETNFVEDLNI